VVTMDWGPPPAELGPDVVVYRTRNVARLSWRAYQAADAAHRSSLKAACTRLAVGLLRTIKTYTLIPDEKILWLPWVLPAIRRVVQKEKPDLMLASGPPFSCLVAAGLAHQRHHLPLVCDIRDDWGGNPLFEKRQSLLRRIEERLERWIVRRSERIVVMTEPSVHLFSQRHPDAQGRTCLVPNGYSEEDFRASPARSIPHFSLVHAGAMEADRSPAVVFAAMAQLDATRRGVHFHQVGVVRREFRELPARSGIDGVVHFEGEASARDALGWMKGASALVLIPTGTAPTAIPGKAYEYLRTGKPILLVSEENATTQFMKRFANVFAVRPDDTAGCAHVLERLLTQPATLPDDVTLQDNLRPFERRELAARLAAVLDSVALAHHTCSGSL